MSKAEHAANPTGLPHHKCGEKSGSDADVVADGQVPIIRDAIIRAAVEAGGGDIVAYLRKQAETHPSAFLTLLGKVLPMQLTGGKGERVNLEFSVRFVAADQEISGEQRRS